MQTELDELRREYEAVKRKKLGLNMTRGKPSPEQLTLSNGLQEMMSYISESGIDCRNYGDLKGIPEAQQFFADYFGVQPTEVIVGGNSSLTLMHDVLSHFLRCGIFGVPWDKESEPYLLCPVPGYDRHFKICEQLGISMINIPMTDRGPDMMLVKKYVAKNENVVGMWCNPKYHNPTGITFSDATVRDLASMKTLNPNFRLICDDAYAVHDLYPESEFLLNILTTCRKYGNEDRPLIFGSTSKITFAGSGVAAMAMSHANLEWVRVGLEAQTIGFDKLNQLRHVNFLRDMPTLRAHMSKHRVILFPKFEAVYRALGKRLGGKGIASWTQPRGGYFVCLEVEPGCAFRTFELAAQAGVELTPPGAPFPHRRDPQDKILRIAPSFPSVEEVEVAMDIVGLCVLIAYAEKQEKKK